MIITILVILGVVIYFFLKDRDASLQNQVDFHGGIQNKYQTLIAFLSNHPQAHISKVSRDYVKINCTMSSTSTTFEILQNFNQIDVFWYSNLGMMGKHSLKWSFDADSDQDTMVEKIAADLKDYENAIF